MIYEEKTFILKNGQEAVLRSPKMGEGGIYLDFLKNICQESEFVLMYPEEIRMNEEAEEQTRKVIFLMKNNKPIKYTVKLDSESTTKYSYGNAKFTKPERPAGE